jgi:hypothetical protein
VTDLAATVEGKGEAKDQGGRGGFGEWKKRGGGFKALAVATDISPPASPCGMCRQLWVFFASFDAGTGEGCELKANWCIAQYTGVL